MSASVGCLYLTKVVREFYVSRRAIGKSGNFSVFVTGPYNSSV